MKQVLLFLTLLICTSTYAEQREKIKSAAEYSKFYAKNVKNYVAYRGLTQEDIRKEFRNNGTLYEININYFGSIVHKSKILTFKKFIKGLPKSGKVGFVVTVDRKQEYKKVYYEVLSEIYDYIYDCRKRLDLTDKELDCEIPYFVICIAKGRYDEKIIPQTDSIPTDSEPILEESSIVIKTDSIIKVAVPKEVVKVKPKKKKAKKEVIIEQSPISDSKIETGKTEALIIVILAIITIIVNAVTYRSRDKFTSKSIFLGISVALELAISTFSIYLFIKLMNDSISIITIKHGILRIALTSAAMIFVVLQQLMLLRNIAACIGKKATVINLKFSIGALLSLIILLLMSWAENINMIQLYKSFFDSILLKQGIMHFISAILGLCAIVCFTGQIIHFITKLYNKPLYLIIMLITYIITFISIGLLVGIFAKY